MKLVAPPYTSIFLFPLCSKSSSFHPGWRSKETIGDLFISIELHPATTHLMERISNHIYLFHIRQVT